MRKIIPLILILMLTGFWAVWGVHIANYISTKARLEKYMAELNYTNVDVYPKRRECWTFNAIKTNVTYTRQVSGIACENGTTFMIEDGGR